MKTEDLIRYRRMYEAMEIAFGTPWLTFAHDRPASDKRGEEARRNRVRVLHESEPPASFHTPYELRSKL